MPQVTLGGFAAGRPDPNPDGGDNGQTTIDDDRHDAARIDVPDQVGAFERVDSRHHGIVVKWLSPRESVSVVRVIGDGTAFEVLASETAAASPGRVLVECDERAAAIKEATAHMRSNSA
jgi:hypothetical protein